MKPVRIYRGDTWQRSWLIKTGAGLPLDLTGATVRLQIRDGYGLMYLEYTDADAITVGDDAGTLALVAPYADIEALDAGEYDFDIEVTLDDVRTTYEKNKLIIVDDVSKDEE